MDFLTHFNLKDFPFHLTPNLEFFCALGNHKNAVENLLFHLESGEGLIKVVGEVGTGKTLLCRKLLHSLNNKDFITGYIPNPDLDKESLRLSVAMELGYTGNSSDNQFDIINHIYQKLMSYHQMGKRVVLIVDEAQALSDEGIETIRLLTNLETQKHKLLQIVLFGQPELDKHLAATHMRQVRQRINVNYYLEPLSPCEIEDYVITRLIIAGHPTGRICTKDALKFLSKASGGIPRIINTLTYRAMLIAWEERKQIIDKKIMKESIHLSKSLYAPAFQGILKKCLYGGYVVIIIAMLIYMSYLIHG
jgi:MSHA biogenesis protein MshM